jgi:Fe-S cluster assembly protein SufD
MSQAVKETSLYGEGFARASERAGAGAPAWTTNLRRNAFERFEALGFPTTDEEDWKYTNVAPIARTVFEPSTLLEDTGLDAEAVAPFIYAEARASRLVFVNGHFRSELSSLDALPEGVVASDLCAALDGEHATTIREHLARAADYQSDAFTALNTAFLDGGAFLYLPDGAQIISPVHLLFLSDANASRPPASFPRVLVVAGRDASATIIESFAATSDESVYFNNAVTEIFVGENARLTHYKVQRESERAFHVASTQAELVRGSSYDLTTVTLGGALSRHNIAVRFLEEGAECWVDGLYLVGTGQHADTHSLIDHRKAHCTSRQNYKGILDGKSRAVFNGRVFVHKDARLTDAVQSNKNLLLSTEARIDTKPQLEIYNDDVKCAHGATVGQLEEEELFYLLSRGLHEGLARNLLTYGFAEEIVEKIKIDSIRAQLDDAILGRLHARLEV